MYNIKFKVPSLTQDTVHSILIEDVSLEDTWTAIKIGEIPDELKAIDHKFTHDINVWLNTNDEGRNELHLSVYELEICLNDPKCIQTKTNNIDPEYIKGVITEIDTNEFNEFINDDEDYFYYNENHDKIECPYTI